MEPQVAARCNGEKKMEKGDIPDKSLTESNRIGEESIKLILDNNLTGGVKRIAEAMSLNPHDHRHYLNRCYCYLRLSKYAQALQDAEYVAQNTKQQKLLFLAKLRAGQATFLLEKYRQAEDYFKQALEIMPDNYQAKRELIRTRATRLVQLGYKERDALFALEKCPTTLEAANHLFDIRAANDGCKMESHSEYSNTNYDDLIYSSDEDEVPTCVQIVNRILNYQPGRVKLQSAPVPTKAPTASSVPTTVLDDNKAIWVGSLPYDISNEMLECIFSQYGVVKYVYRPFNANYAFVNFESSQAASKALSSDVYGVAGCTLNKLKVKWAQRRPNDY